MSSPTGYTYDMDESRKRQSGDDGNNDHSKRMNFGNNSQPLLKILVPNYVAGALIGKGGSLMKEMKEQFGCNIRLSANGEVYPGTDERVIVMTGETSQIMELNNCIMEKVRDVTTRLPTDDTRREKAKLVLTSTAAGMLIGRGGATVKAIHDASKARISICNTDAATFLGERVLTMSGSMDQRVEACRLIIDKISTDASNMANTNLKYINAGVGAGPEVNMGRPHQQERGLGLNGNFPVKNIGMDYANPIDNSFTMIPSRVNLKTKVEVKIEVPEAFVGPFMGKSGQFIREMAQQSGTRLKFSDKDEFAEGTTDRILTITANTFKQAHTAYCLANERIEVVQNQLSQKTRFDGQHNQNNKRPIDNSDSLLGYSVGYL